MSRLSVVVSLSAACAACAAFASLAVEMAEPKDVPPLFPPGAWVPNAKNWHAGRRAEIKKILADEVYGHRPVERPPHLAFSEVSPEKTMMDGNAMRRLVKIEYGGKYGTNSFSVTAFVPNAPPYSTRTRLRIAAPSIITASGSSAENARCGGRSTGRRP